MIFYNGFNLLVDLVLVFIAFVIGHGIGYRKNKPDQGAGDLLKALY